MEQKNSSSGFIDQYEKLLGLLKFACENQGTDLHLATGSRAMIRIKGQMRQIDTQIFSEDDIKGFCYPALSGEQVILFNREQQITSVFSHPDVGQFRMKIFKQQTGISATVRMFPGQLLPVEEKEELKRQTILQYLRHFEKRSFDFLNR